MTTGTSCPASQLLATLLGHFALALALALASSQLSKDHGESGESSGEHHGGSGGSDVLLATLTLAIAVPRGAVAGAAGRGALLASVGGDLAGVVDLVVLHGGDLEALDLVARLVENLELHLEVADVDELAVALGGDTVVNHLADVVDHGGQSPVGVEAVAGDELVAALGGLNVLLLSLDSHEGLPVDLEKLVLEAVVVAEELGRVTLEVNETIVLVLLGVLVDEATGEDGAHVVAVESNSLVPPAGLAQGLVAAVLGEEDGDGAGLELVGELIVGRGLVSGIDTTPAVRVETVDVATAQVVLLALDCALAVVPGVVGKVTDIGSRVANGDGALEVLLDVALEITGDGADVGRGDLGGRLVVDDLVAGEVEQGVGVVGESLYDSKGAVDVSAIVALPGVVGGDGLTGEGRVDVDDHVHASLLLLVSGMGCGCASHGPRWRLTALKILAHLSWSR